MLFLSVCAILTPVSKPYIFSILETKGVDFVALRGSKKVYIRVSNDISRGTTFAREVAPLLAIKDAYPKMIPARTRHPKYPYEGITVFDLTQWLREEG